MQALAILVDRGLLWLSLVEGAPVTEINQQRGPKVLDRNNGFEGYFCVRSQWFELTGTKYVSIAK